MSGRSSKHTSLKKGRPGANRRNRKKRCLIVSGGEVTEAQYFEVLQTRYQNLVLCVKTDVGSPDQLASYASSVVSGGKSRTDEDGYKAIFVVADVDQFQVERFREARKKCDLVEALLVISNPCFEVWLIDYRQTCPDSFTTTKACEGKAEALGLVDGQRNKALSSAFICDVAEAVGNAMSNAERHNTDERKSQRERLDSLDFAPWTDMPALIESLDRLNQG
ncbi:RloB-like protein [Olsenella sp. KH3B4]|uniref:RloB family protein n=1 Tax=Olsenella sp. KH3B4 TaxID=1855394 RepID=UPI0008CF1878|nr:RloB family protein [Olsenella sp. KH3B4]SET31019.1 RloB-like protein [Olsenella sp. KH3B4]